MKYALIESGVVVQIQPNKQDGFIEVDNSVVCGMIGHDGGFIIPVHVPTDIEISLELEDALASKLNEIDKKAQEKIELGFSSSALGDAHKYDCRKGLDASDLAITIEGAIGSGNDQPYMAQHTAQHFADHTHTLAQLRQVAVDMRAHTQSHRIIARTKKSAATNARNSNDLAAIQAVDVTDWV